jgi:hypothetical protein
MLKPDYKRSTRAEIQAKSPYIYANALIRICLFIGTTQLFTTNITTRFEPAGFESNERAAGISSPLAPRRDVIASSHARRVSRHTHAFLDPP